MNNILFLSSNISNPGGTERIAIGVANELTRSKRYKVTILSLFGENRPFFDVDTDIVLETLLRNHIPLPLVYPLVVVRLRNYIKKNNIDLVIGIGTLLSLISLPATRFLKTKNFAWEHFNFSLSQDSRKEKWARILAARYSEAIIMLTKTDKELFKKSVSGPAKLCVIPNFLTLKPEGRSCLTSTEALAIGRLTHQKGFDSLIKIWKEVIVDHQEWSLKIVGSGEEREALEALINQLGIQKSVTIVPTTSKVSSFYQNAALFLVTSRWEGLPMVMIEAQSFGLPMVSFDCLTGPRDIISHQVDGLLIADQDKEEFTSELKKLMSNRKLIQEMGLAAYKHSRFFSSDVIMSRWYNLLDEFI